MKHNVNEELSFFDRITGWTGFCERKSPDVESCSSRTAILSIPLGICSKQPCQACSRSEAKNGDCTKRSEARAKTGLSLFFANLADQSRSKPLARIAHHCSWRECVDAVKSRRSRSEPGDSVLKHDENGEQANVLRWRQIRARSRAFGERCGLGGEEVVDGIDEFAQSEGFLEEDVEAGVVLVRHFA